MIPLLKSEFKKLLTVRTTYFICLLAFLLTAIGGFYIEGISKTGAPLDQHKIAGTILNSATLFGQLGAIVVILLMANEYRYNLIIYTLTRAKSRSRALAAKVIASSAFILVFSAFCIMWAVGLTYLGLKFRNAHLPGQTPNLLGIAGQAVYYSFAFSMFGLLFITLTRNLVASITMLFVLPTIVEGLLGILLKNNITYLPFSALGELITQNSTFSPIKAVAISGSYLIVGWLIAWKLFLKRDAN